jgi:hypothetical protein
MDWYLDLECYVSHLDLDLQTGDDLGSGSEDAASATSSDTYKRPKGFSLGNIFSLSRKKGDKVKRMLAEAAAAESVDVGPDTLIAGEYCIVAVEYCSGS